MLGASTPLPFDPAVLLRSGALRLAGVTPGAAEYVRVRHGIWMLRTDWDPLTPVQRHAAFVHATALRCDTDHPPVFSHTSAAAVWGLPGVDPWPARADALVSDERVRSSRLVVKHVGAEDSPREVGGLQVTSPARTVLDLARTTSLANGLAAADHALRHGLCTVSELTAELAAVPRKAPGRARATLVCDLADARSMSAGESLSRAQMFLLNLPRPDLQVPFSDVDGHVGDVDFGWENIVGEFDGRVKYAVPEGLPGDQAGRVLWAEKTREDRLRRLGLAVARWTWRDACDARRLLSILMSAGVKPQRRSTWFGGSDPCVG